MRFGSWGKFTELHCQHLADELVKQKAAGDLEARNLEAVSPCGTLTAQLNVAKNTLKLIEREGGSVLLALGTVSVTDGTKMITAAGTLGMMFEDFELKFLQHDGSQMVFSLESKELRYVQKGHIYAARRKGRMAEKCS